MPLWPLWRQVVLASACMLKDRGPDAQEQRRNLACCANSGLGGTSRGAKVSRQQVKDGGPGAEEQQRRNHERNAAALVRDDIHGGKCAEDVQKSPAQHRSNISRLSRSN